MEKKKKNFCKNNLCAATVDGTGILLITSQLSF